MIKAHAGLGLIGAALNECTDLAADAEAVSPLRSDAMPHANILLSYVVLACLGKSDFEGSPGFDKGMDGYSEGYFMMKFAKHNRPLSLYGRGLG